MLNFLNSYSKAICLDDTRFTSLFKSGVKKSDFLLFGETTICEYKEIMNFNVQKRLEHIVRKGVASESNFKRDIYNTISNSLSTANQQIKETKEVLDKASALGLVILENKIPSDLSILGLIDVAERKMLEGLSCVDAVLCLDFSNTFIDKNGLQIQPAQILTRDTDKSKGLYHLVGDLMEDFTKSIGTTLDRNFSIFNANQTWSTDSEGRYIGLRASINKNEN